MHPLKDPQITKISTLEAIICPLSQTRAPFHHFNSSEFQRTSMRKYPSKGAFELPLVPELFSSSPSWWEAPPAPGCFKLQAQETKGLNQLIHFYTLKGRNSGETMAKHKQNYFSLQIFQISGNICILFQIPTMSLQTTVMPIIRHIPTELTQESNVHFLAPKTITERAMEARYGNNNINSLNHCQSTTDLCWAAWTKPEPSPRNKQKKGFWGTKASNFHFPIERKANLL